MLKRKALMESVSSNLHNLLKKIGKNLSLPVNRLRQKKKNLQKRKRKKEMM